MGLWVLVNMFLGVVAIMISIYIFNNVCRATTFDRMGSGEQRVQEHLRLLACARAGAFARRAPRSPRWQCAIAFACMCVSITRGLSAYEKGQEGSVRTKTSSCEASPPAPQHSYAVLAAISACEKGVRSGNVPSFIPPLDGGRGSGRAWVPGTSWAGSRRRHRVRAVRRRRVFGWRRAGRAAGYGLR